MTAVRSSFLFCLAEHFRSAKHGVESSCSARGEKFGHSDEVVRRGDHMARQLGASDTFVSRSAEAADGLHPSEDLFNALAKPLADGVARVTRRACIDRRTTTPSRVAGHVRGDVHRAAIIDE